jgi:hypothetical protein
MKLLIAVISALAAMVSGQPDGKSLRAVDTPNKLQQALLDGASHIIITKHLDLTKLSRVPDTVFDDGVLVTKPSTQTIRVSSLEYWCLDWAQMPSNQLFPRVNEAQQFKNRLRTC